jgi:hypothetical protein
VAKSQPVATLSATLSSGGLRVYAIGAGQPRALGSKFTFWAQLQSHNPDGVGYLLRVPMRRVLFLPSFDVAEILMLAASVLLIAAIVYVI